MWWLIGSAPDFWGKSSGLESGISVKYCKISGWPKNIQNKIAFLCLYINMLRAIIGFFNSGFSLMGQCHEIFVVVFFHFMNRTPQQYAHD